MKITISKIDGRKLNVEFESLDQMNVWLQGYFTRDEVED